MSVDQVQLIIDYFSREAITDLVGSRIWVRNTIPKEVEYNPGQGPAIVISRRGGVRPYVDGLRDPRTSIRVYGQTADQIRAVCDLIDELHASQGIRAIMVIDVEWQDDQDPSTGWLFSFALATMRLRIA